MVFHRSLINSKSSQVSRTLPCILSDLNNAVVWIVSSYRLISKSSSSFINPLGIVPIATITISITVTFMFHIFFSSLHNHLSQEGKVHYCGRFSFFFFFFFWLSLGLVVWPRLGDKFLTENSSEVCESYFPGWILSCAFTSGSWGQI